MKLKFSVYYRVLQFVAFLTLITSFALVYQSYLLLPTVLQDLDTDSDPIENEKEPWKNFRLPENIQERVCHFLLTKKFEFQN